MALTPVGRSLASQFQAIKFSMSIRIDEGFALVASVTFQSSKSVWNGSALGTWYTIVCSQTFLYVAKTN